MSGAFQKASRAAGSPNNSQCFAISPLSNRQTPQTYWSTLRPTRSAVARLNTTSNRSLASAKLTIGSTSMVSLDSDKIVFIYSAKRGDVTCYTLAA